MKYIVGYFTRHLIFRPVEVFVYKQEALNFMKRKITNRRPLYLYELVEVDQ